MANKTKIKELLDKLNSLEGLPTKEIGDFADQIISQKMKGFSDEVRNDSTIKLLDGINQKLEQFKTDFNLAPIDEQVTELQNQITSLQKDFGITVKNQTNDLNTKIQTIQNTVSSLEKQSLNDPTKAFIPVIDNLKKQLADISVSRETDKVSLTQQLSKVSSDFSGQLKELADSKSVEKAKQEAISTLSASLAEIRTEFLNKISSMGHGGSANRNIVFSNSVLGRYTDLNILGASYVNNDKTKQADVTLPSTGGGSMTIGSAVGGGSANSVLYIDTNGDLAQDPNDFYFTNVPGNLAKNTNVSLNINGSAFGNIGDNALNVGGQITAFLPNSAITNNIASLGIDGNVPGLQTFSFRGTGASLLQLQSGDMTGGIVMEGATGNPVSAFPVMGGIISYASGSTTNNLGGEMRFYTKSDGGILALRMTISNAGVTTITGNVIAPSFNSVALTAAGSASSFLNASGTYTVPAGSTSIGGTVTSGTNGSVLFINPTGTLAQNNNNFYVNNSGTGLASNTSIAVNINTNGDQSGDNAINFYGQATAFLLNSQITNTITGYSTDGAIPGLLVSSLRGTIAAQQPLQVGDTVGGITYQLPTGTAGTITFGTGAGIYGFAAGSTTANLGMALGFFTKADNGALSQVMTLDQAGRLGIGTTVPTAGLTLAQTFGEHLFNTVDQTTNYERGNINWNANNFVVGTYAGGTGTARSLVLGVATAAGSTSVPDRRITVSGVATAAVGNFDFTVGTGSTGSIATFNTSLTAASAQQNMVSIQGTVTQTGTASNTALLIAPFISSTGAGASLLIDAGTNSAGSGGGTHTQRFLVDSNGNVLTSSRVAIGTVSGVPSAQLYLTNGYSTGQTFSTAGLGIRIDPSTYTSSTSTGTISVAGINTVGIPTLIAASATTLSSAATFYIDGAPTASTNITITKGFALMVNAGMSLLQGGITTSGLNLDGAPNFFASGGQTMSLNSIAGILFGGSTGVNSRAGFMGGFSSTMSANSNYTNIIVGSATVTTAGTGTNAWANNLTINPVGTITSGASGVVTNTATVYINGTNTNGTNNYALYIASGATYVGGKVVGYNAITTTGWGTPAIYGYNRPATGQTAAVASVAAYTVGAADGTFYISANVLVTASVTHNFTVTCTYTDEGNTSRTLTLNFSQLTGTFLTAITNVQGVGAYEGIPLHIRCKASTAITIATAGTFTSVTYNVEGLITQLA